MLNAIWLGMMLLAVVVGMITGHIDQVVQAVITSAKFGFEIALNLAAVLKRLFPDVPETDPAMGAMVLNIAANMLGMANAATPFGLQAMKELQRLNTHVHTASNSMCVFLAINTSSVQLIPATAMAYLAANGSLHPSSVIMSSLIATSVSTIVALIAVTQLAKLPIYQIKNIDNL